MMFAPHKPKAAPTPGTQSQQRAAAVRPGETSQICFFTSNTDPPALLPDSLACCPLFSTPNTVLSLVLSHENDLKEPLELTLFK